MFDRPDASPRDLVIDAALRVARDHAPDTPTDPPAVGVVTEINPRFAPHDAVLHRVPDGRDDSLPSAATVRHTLQTLADYGWLHAHAPGVLKAVDWRTAGTD